MPMPRKSERTRQRIVEAANRLFYHKGYNQTSFSDVVEAAGVPRGNIYYYFKTKDEILEAPECDSSSVRPRIIHSLPNTARRSASYASGSTYRRVGRLDDTTAL